MNRARFPVDDRDLLRRLHGELSAVRAAAVDRALAGDPALAARFRRLAEVWGGLELPPPAAPPPGFTGRVMARVREPGGAAGGDRPQALGWAQAPRWARAAGAAALAAGVLLGAGLGREPSPAPAAASGPATAAADPAGELAEDLAPVWPAGLDAGVGLADDYWDAVGLDPAGTDTTAGEPS